MKCCCIILDKEPCKTSIERTTFKKNCSVPCITWNFVDFHQHFRHDLLSLCVGAALRLPLCLVDLMFLEFFRVLFFSYHGKVSLSGSFVDGVRLGSEGEVHLRAAAFPMDHSRNLFFDPNVMELVSCRTEAGVGIVRDRGNR